MLKQWMASARLKASAIAIISSMVAGMLAPTAEAVTPTATPSVKIGTAALIDPNLADTSFYGTSTSATTSVGSYATPNEIVELARSLDNNVDLIYEFVQNNVDVAWMYGLQKGALGALVDRSGTSFDQAALMVGLLRQAGYTANYQAGIATFNAAQFQSWTGITSAQAACQLLSSGGIPASINGTTSITDCTTFGSATVSSVQMSHIWVSATISGTNYVFDPSYKTYTQNTGLNTGTNLASLAGLSSGAAVAAASPASSGTTGPNSDINYVQNLSGSGNLTSLLNGYGSSMLSAIKTNVPAGEIESLVGGPVIQRFTTPAGGLRQTSLPYSTSTQHTWSGNIPDQYRTKLSVQLNNGGSSPLISQTLFVDEIYGRKLNFDTNFAPSASTFTGNLNLVDEFGGTRTLATVTWAMSNGTTGSNWANSTEGTVNLTAQHPYAGSANGTTTLDGSYVADSVTKYVRFILPFTIVHGWGDVGRGGINEKWGTRIDSTIHPLVTNGCETCFSTYFSSKGDGRREQLAASWLAQSSRAARLHAAIAHAVYTHHHSMGVVAAESSVDAININPPGTNYAYSVDDSFDRIDVESGISLTSVTATALDRRAAIHAIAATNEALEGSVIAQTSDLPDTSSTATRFAWGDAPPLSEEGPTCSGSSPCPRRFLEFTSSNLAELNVSGNGLLKMEDSVNTPAYSTQTSAQCIVQGSYISYLSAAISTYANNSFDVVASEESFLGPGQRCGALFPVTKGTQSSRWPTFQRGGALIATRYASNGTDPLEIAHIVIGVNEASKGGGGGVQTDHQAQYDPSTAADVLKSKFVDRSKVLGVDLQSGKVSATSAASLTVGNGGFPYALSAQLIWRGGDVQSTRFGPISHVQPQAPWTTNWNNTLTVSGSGLETMGDGDIRATAGTVAAFLALQDVYKSSPSPRREVTGALVAAWWARQLSGNVITANVGTDTRQFVNTTPWVTQLSTGSWISTGSGTSAQLQVSGNRTIYTTDCTGSTNPGDYQLTRGWNYSGMSFAITNPHGDVQNFVYWGQSINDSTSAWCAYQKGFRLASWVFPQGVTVNLTYSAGSGIVGNGDPLPYLSQVSNSLGRSINFTSSGLGGFSSGNDSRSVTVTNLTDSNYNNIGVTHTDAAGDTNTYLSGISGGKYILSQVYTADNPYNNNASAPNAASVQYVYDTLDRVKQASDGVTLQQGTSVRAPYQFMIAEGLRGERADPLGGRYTGYYDNRKRPFGYIDELGNNTAMAHDGRGRVTSTTYPEGDQELLGYDDHNNTTSLTKIAKPGSGLANLNISASWDQTWNKPLLVQDAKGNQASFTYYPSGNTGASLIHTATLPAVSDRGGSPANPVWTYVYNPRGQVSTVTDPTGVLTQNSYDETSGSTTYGYLLTAAVDPTNLNLTTSYTYDAAGNALTVTDGRGKTTSSVFDNDRRVTSATPPASTCIKTENTYTGGLLTKVRKATKCSPNESTDSDWAVTLTAYTPTRQPWITLDPSLYETVTAYDGDDHPTDVTQCLTANSSSTLSGSCPGASRTTHTTYYADGKVNQVYKGWGSADQITYSTTTYSQNRLPLTVGDANGNITTSVYDGFDRLYRLCLPDSTGTCSSSPSDYEQYGYDNNGNLTSKRNRDGFSLSFGFDALNRETSRTVPSNANGHFSRGLATTYDLASRKWDVSVTDGETGTSISQTLQHRYDTAGRLNLIGDTLLNAVGASIGNVALTYDAASNLSTETVYTSGTSWGPTYNYDDAERLSSVTSGSYTMVGYGLDPLSRRTSKSLLDGTSATYAYFANGDLQTLSDNWNGGSRVENFTTSGAHQILTDTVNDSTWESKVTSSTQSYSVNSLNQYSNVGGTAIGYNSNGNLTSDGTYNYEYDEENRLRGVTGAGHTIIYDYDPLGRRRAKTVDGVKTNFISNPDGNELAETDANGARQRLYVYGSGMDDRVAMYTDNGGTWDLYHVDHHGSTFVMSRWGSNGQLVANYRYDPYGVTSDANTGNPFRYTGRYLDAETGLYYYRARYYSPTLGRFLQTDPIGSKDDLNLYAYVQEDPINKTDPTGLDSTDKEPGKIDPSGAKAGPLKERSGLAGKVSAALNKIASKPNSAESIKVDAAKIAVTRDSGDNVKVQASTPLGSVKIEGKVSSSTEKSEVDFKDVSVKSTPMFTSVKSAPTEVKVFDNAASGKLDYQIDRPISVSTPLGEKTQAAGTYVVPEGESK